MPSLSIRMRVEPIRSIAFGSIGATYAPLGTPFTHPISIMHFTNMTDAAVMISFDGSVDHIVLAAGGYLVLDITSDKANTEGLFATSGTQMYVKRLSGAPSTGSLYLSTFYAASQ